MNGLMRVAASCVLAAGLSLSPSVGAIAQTSYTENGELVCTGMMGAIFNKSAIEGTQRAWATVDVETRNCMAMQGVNPSDLAARCIGPNDARVQPLLQACRQQVESVRLAREAEARRVAAQSEARERDRRVQATAKQQAEQKRRDLVARFGEQWIDAILAGKVELNMEPAVVLEIRGEPRRKDKIPPNYELWIYADSRIAFGDGKVTSISQ